MTWAIRQSSKEEAHDPTRLVRVSGYPLDTMNKADGLDLLRGTPNEYAKLVIFDPQYRQVGDQLKFGNEGERQKGRAILPQQSNFEINQFGAAIVRVAQARRLRHVVVRQVHPMPGDRDRVL